MIGNRQTNLGNRVIAIVSSVALFAAAIGSLGVLTSPYEMPQARDVSNLTARVWPGVGLVDQFNDEQVIYVVASQVDAEEFTTLARAETQRHPVIVVADTPQANETLYEAVMSPNRIRVIDLRVPGQ